jgi:hypothetical protein
MPLVQILAQSKIEKELLAQMIACWSLFLSEQRIVQLEKIFEIKRKVTDRVK